MNKGQIRTQFLQLLNRNDCSNELADTFIEQSIKRTQRTLRVPDMESLATYTIGGGITDSLTLPADWLATKHLYGEDYLLEHVDLQRFFRYSLIGDKALVYTKQQLALKIRPQPPEGSVLSLVYYADIPLLTTDSSTNWLSEVAPEVIWYGALGYACDYFVDDRKQMFEDSYARAYAQVEEQGIQSEMTQSAMAIAPAYGTDY